VDVGSFLALIVAVVSAVVAILAVREARKANGDRWAFEWAAQRLSSTRSCLSTGSAAESSTRRPSVPAG
jgi:hypothetical protein